MYFFVINRNEKKEGEYGSILREGEIHFDINHEVRRGFQFSWNLWTHFCAASLHFDIGGDHDTEIHLALPPFSFWISMNRILPRRWLRNLGHRMDSDRCIELTIHNWAIWWYLWVPRDYWDSKTPKWRNGSFHIDDFFLGRRNHTKENLGPPQEVFIPLREGTYKGTAQLSKSTWKRPRWFKQERYYVEFTFEHDEAIPCVSRKGEFFLSSLTVEGKKLSTGIGNLVKYILQEREEHRMGRYTPRKTDEQIIQDWIPQIQNEDMRKELVMALWQTQQG